MKIDPSKIDWSLSDAENARLLLCHPASISRLRHSLGINPVTPHKTIDWTKADWKLTDPEISRALGCSNGAVRVARNRLGKRKSKAFKTDWKSVDWSKTNAQLMKQHKASFSTVSGWRARLKQGKRGRPKLLTPKMANQLSERKTVHQWLTGLGIVSEEFGKKICLLRRLRIALDELYSLKNPDKSVNR